MLIPSNLLSYYEANSSLSRRVNANSQPGVAVRLIVVKLIKKGEC